MVGGKLEDCTIDLRADVFTVDVTVLAPTKGIASKKARAEASNVMPFRKQNVENIEKVGDVSVLRNRYTVRISEQ